MKNLQLKYSYEIKEGDIVIKKIRPRKCKSFTRNFSYLVFASFGFGYVTAVDTSNVTTASTMRGITNGGVYIFKVTTGTSGITTSGVLVGTGSTTPTINDYAMETLIAHGTSAGELQYGATTVGSPSATANTATFRTTRIFTNGSGGSITVEEIGLVCYTGVIDGASYYFLIIHDVTGGVAVADGQSLTINYDLTTTI